MRKAWLAGVLILVSIVLQLTVLNGLRLPGGGGSRPEFSSWWQRLP